MKRRFTQLLFTSAIVLLSFKGGAQIVNGTFDVNNPGYGFYCGAPYGWTSSNYTGWGGDIQWENQWNPDGDSWWIDLTGCGYGNWHWVEQTIPTIPGEIYTLSFDLGCWDGQYHTNAGADVYIEGEGTTHYEHTDFSLEPLTWKKFTHCFIAKQATTLIRFTGNGAATVLTPSWCVPVDNYVGVIGLDNVKLVKEDMQILQTTNCVPSLLTQHSSSGGAGQWYFNGQPMGTGPFIMASNPGLYSLVYGTECGVLVDEVTMIDCKEMCPLDEHMAITSIGGFVRETFCAGQTVKFTGSSTNPIMNLQYIWEFGDGTTTGNGFMFMPVVTHVYNTPGVYNVCMTVRHAGEWKPTDCEPGPYKNCRTVTIVDCPNGWDEEYPYDPPGDGGTKSGNIIPMSYSSLNVFPNPATDLVTVQGLLTEDSDVMLSLYNLAGELVYEQPVAAGAAETTFSIKAFDAGVYLLKVRGTTYYKEIKLVKQ